MKRILTMSALLALTLTAVKAQNKQETIEGNGKLITRQVSVSGFDALKASGVYELELSQGSKEAVSVEADENLQPYIDVRVEGNTLIIDMAKAKNKNLKNKTKMKVSVTVKTLKQMDLTMVGDVHSSALTVSDLQLSNRSVGDVDLNIKAGKLTLENKSVGEVKIKGSAETAVVKNNGVGELDAGDFVVQIMDIENKGVGEATVNAAKSLTVKDSFLGKVKNEGNAKVRRLNVVKA